MIDVRLVNDGRRLMNSKERTVCFLIILVSNRSIIDIRSYWSVYMNINDTPQWKSTFLLYIYKVTVWNWLFIVYDVLIIGHLRVPYCQLLFQFLTYLTCYCSIQMHFLFSINDLDVYTWVCNEHNLMSLLITRIKYNI
jgi:hypothetical protein